MATTLGMADLSPAEALLFDRLKALQEQGLPPTKKALRRLSGLNPKTVHRFTVKFISSGDILCESGEDVLGRPLPNVYRLRRRTS